MSIEAMKLALENAQPSFMTPGWTLVRNEDISALRQAIEQAEQAQPVAVTAEMARAFHRAITDGPLSQADEFEIQTGLEAAFAHITAQPPRQPEQAQPVATWENKYGMKEWQVHALRAGWSITPPPRQPLTDEQIKAVLVSVDPETKRLPSGFRDFARAIEAAHGIKGEA